MTAEFGFNQSVVVGDAAHGFSRRCRSRGDEAQIKEKLETPSSSAELRRDEHVVSCNSQTAFIRFYLRSEFKQLRNEIGIHGD
jgi:hypothetical protein